MDEQTIKKPAIRLIFFYGKGGAGKDAQRKQMVAENPQWSGISTGDEIHSAIRNPNSKHHSKVAMYEDDVKNGKYLPDSVVIDLENPRDGIYSEFVEEQLAAGAEVLISTGFPRTISQLGLVDQYISQLQESYNVSSTHIYLDASDDTARRRSSGRRASAIARNEIPREDDDPEMVEKRLKVFNELTFPIIERLAEEGRLIVVSAEGTREQVNEVIKRELGQIPLEIHEPNEISHPGRERF